MKAGAEGTAKKEAEGERATRERGRVREGGEREESDNTEERPPVKTAPSRFGFDLISVLHSKFYLIM